jgi:hypothetical protein
MYKECRYPEIGGSGKSESRKCKVDIRPDSDLSDAEVRDCGPARACEAALRGVRRKAEAEVSYWLRFGIYDPGNGLLAGKLVCYKKRYFAASSKY